MAWEFQTFNSDFILLGIFDHSTTHILLFFLVLGVSAVAIMGNTLVVLFLYLDTQLHTPMYFLLSQLPLMDLMGISTNVPKMVFNYPSGSKFISVAGCATQIFSYTSLLGCEYFLLAVIKSWWWKYLWSTCFIEIYQFAKIIYFSMTLLGYRHFLFLYKFRYHQSQNTQFQFMHRKLI